MRYFLALAEERHFGRAAARLHIAQPPLTRNIRALEEELGAELFRRTSKGAELTAAGQALLEEVPNVLSLAQRARERAMLAARGMSGRLDIGIFGSGMLDVIPRLIARFRDERPGVRVVLHNLTKMEQIVALRERRITVGFNRLVPAEPDLVIETVLREGLVVALYDSHPLAHKRRISLRDLDQQPLILYPNLPMAGLAEMVADAFRKEGVRLEVAQRVEDVLTCISLVACRFGVAVTTESTASLQLPGVVYRPLRSRHLRDIELSVIYRADDRSPILGAFLSGVHAYAAQLERDRAASRSAEARHPDSPRGRRLPR